MMNTQNTRRSFSTGQRRTATERHRGIILLVVLGMLALFSLLAATYIIFSARSREAAVAIGRREVRQVDTKRHLDESISQVLRGPSNNSSSLFTHSLLEDYYGNDQLIGKVINRNAQDPDGVFDNTAPYALIPDARFGPEVMLGRNPGQPSRQAEFVKIPIQVNDLSPDPSLAIPNQFSMEDALVGRFLVFDEGPLSGLMLEIVRSYGNMPASDIAIANRNSVVVSLADHLTRPIEIGGTTELLFDWLPASFSVRPQVTGSGLGLFYDPASTLRRGYQFHITPKPKNGKGLGWANAGGVYNQSVTLSPEQSMPVISTAPTAVPVAFQANFKLSTPNPAMLSSSVAVDEAVDVPDYRDYLLGYYPAHANDPTDPSKALAGLTAPSGIRPGMLYYLVNLFGDALRYNRTTFEYEPRPNVWISVQQRFDALRMLQRASLRPIPVTDGNPSGTRYPNGDLVDLTEGEFANFTGSNIAPGGFLDKPIDVQRLSLNGPAGVLEAQKLIQMYQQLIFGPWDVDNDSEGIADSVWIDAGLGLVTMPDGALVKPMIAMRIEDLDSRVDVNVADSASSVASTSIAITNSLRPNQMVVVPGQTTATELFGGYGVGPAEIVLQSMFRMDRAAQLITRRYGADHSPGVAPSGVSAFPVSAGNDLLSVWGSFGRTPFHNVDRVQLLNSMGNPIPGKFAPRSSFGYPVDYHGRSLLAIDPFGQPVMNNAMTENVVLPFGTVLGNDQESHPYEMLYDNVSGPDLAYGIGELEPVLRFRDWDRNEFPGRLRSIVEDELTAVETVGFNERLVNRDTLPRAITTVSASLNQPGMTLPAEYERGSNPQGSNYIDGLVADQQLDFSPMSRLALSLVVRTRFGETYSEPKIEAMFPPELRQGHRLNLNRPFGNGQAIGDLTVDNSNELMLATEAIFAPPTGSVYQTLGDFTPQIGVLPYSSPGPLNPEQLEISDNWPPAAVAQKFQNQHSRVELARHLYVMAMLLTARRTGAGPNNYELYDYRANAGGGGINERREAMARRLAQWAVNVIDFRDRDAIMTRFPYDDNPFDGWDEPGPNDPPLPVVWGFENPELLMTENFSFHDRRILDTNFVGGIREPMGDDHPDQIRIPQGSTYIELYCPRGPKPINAISDLHSSPPPELYSMARRSFLDGDNSNNNVNDPDVVPVLDLGRLAPDGNPVWRIGIATHPHLFELNPVQSPLERMNAMDLATWDALTFDPARGLDLNNHVDPDFQFERVIWFANQSPTAVGIDGINLPTDTRVNTRWTEVLAPERVDESRVYFNRFGAGDYFEGVVAGLQGGQYAVVGPRRRTYVGSQQYPEATGPVTWSDSLTRQSFDLHPQSDTNFNFRFRALVPGQDPMGNLTSLSLTPQDNSNREVVPIMAAAREPAGWADAAETAPNGIGINISEPIPGENYYREPAFYLNSDEPTDPNGLTGFAKDSYIDYRDPAGSMQVVDEPFDYEVNYPFQGLVQTGTRENFRSAYLQRLADPTVRYDPILNPYLTVDWMPMDVTVFNGEQDNSDTVDDGMGGRLPVDPLDPNPYGNEIRLASRVKDGLGINPDGTDRFVAADHILWSYGTNRPELASQPAVPPPGYTPNFPFVLFHKNDVNGSYAAAINEYAALPPTAHGFTMGFLNDNFGARTVSADRIWSGAPVANPFPWLGFLNRDFASPYEVMMVPASSPDRLMLEFSIPVSSGRAPFDPYAGKAAANGPDDPAQRDFGHLLNFFANSTNLQLAPNLYRLFEFIETADPFIESKELMDPVRLKNPETARELDAMSIYFPPFNIVTKEPRAGRINLNTVSNPLVWRSLMHLHATTLDRDSTTMSGGEGDDAMFWREWMLSRRGYNDEILPVEDATTSPLDPNFPTQFRGALQPAESAWIAPATKNPGDPTLGLRFSGVESTLLRSVDDPATNDSTRKTLFTRPARLQDDKSVGRNSFFRYQTLMRMPNLVTDNSNAFAVWITVGYFEVDPTNLQVGREYGIDQGTNVRPKAFYIIDRTVPVDFVPGQDTNVRDVIQLERVLN